MALHLITGDDESLVHAAVTDLVRRLVGDGDRTMMVDDYGGDEYELRAVVDAASIKRFSGEFDRQVFHLDEAAAQTTFFGEMVASGWHTTAVTMQLIVDTLPLSHGIIGSGVDELRWPRPVRPGDTLHLHCEIIAVTPSKLHPSRGTVRVRMTTLNQKDQPVQTMVANLLAFRRPEQDA